MVNIILRFPDTLAVYWTRHSYFCCLVLHTNELVDAVSSFRIHNVVLISKR